MWRRIVGLVVVLALIMGLAPAAFAKGKDDDHDKGKYKAPKFEKRFKDWAEAAWALKYITRMSAKGIARGYEDGSFKPNSSVSEAEAVVMVIRMKGTDVEQAAVAMAMERTGVANMNAAWWANGHVAYALKQGWITVGDFQPQRAAKRTWVARLMVRAMVTDWQAQVIAHANDVLPFKDANQISNFDKPYVALAVANNWMVGYPNGQFQPNKPVTRAELLTLLDRGEAGSGTQNPYELVGVITAVDAAAKSLTLRHSAGGTSTVPIAADALIFVEGSQGALPLSSLLVGDTVKVLINGSGVAIIISVEDDKVEVSGKVTAINLTAASRTISITPTGTTLATTYSLSDECKAYWSWTEIPLANVAVGDTVKLTTYRAAVRKIQVTQHTTTPINGSTITGTLQSISTVGTTTTLVVRDANNVNWTYPLSATAALTSGGAVITVAQLAVGQSVQVVVVNGQITTVAVTAQNQTSSITGTLQSISTVGTTTTLVVRDANNVSFTYPLSATAALTSGGAVITVAQLAVGQSVQVTVVNNQITAVAVTAQNQTSSITGTIQSISTVGTVTTLVVRDANNVSFTYPLSATAALTSAGAVITVAQLAVGQSVQVTVLNNQITAVAVTAQATTQVSGTLQSISTSNNTTWVTIRDANNVSFSHQIASNAVLTWGSTTITAAQLQVGLAVTATVQNQAITAMNVTSPVTSEVTGAIQAVTTNNGVTSLTIRDSNNVDHLYPIASNATMTSGSVAITVSQLTTGLHVRVTVTGGSITTLTVISGS